MLRQLSMGPRSRAQLARQLAQRGCAPQVATAVLDRQQEVGLVDDVAFADHLVQARRRTKGLAGAALLVELREKGVDREVAHTAIGGLDPQTDRARAEALATRKLATMTGLDPQVQARRFLFAVVRDVQRNTTTPAAARKRTAVSIRCRARRTAELCGAEVVELPREGFLFAVVRDVQRNEGG